MSIQTAYAQDPAAGFAGMIADMSDADVVSGVLSSRKLVSVAITASNSQVYVATINGTAFTYTADSSASTAEITAGLVSLINAGAQPVHASGTDTPLLIESTEDGPDGDFTSAYTFGTGNMVETVLVAQDEAIGYGLLVCEDERTAGTDLGMGAEDFPVRACRLSTDITSNLRLGVTVDDPARSLGAYKSNTMVGVLTKGKIWVKVDQAVVRGGDVYVRYASGAHGTVLGAFGAGTDTTTAALLPGAKYLTSAATGALALLQMRNP